MPSVYAVGGKQYVGIAAGGREGMEALGDDVVAYTLDGQGKEVVPARRAGQLPAGVPAPRASTPRDSHAPRLFSGGRIFSRFAAATHFRAILDANEVSLGWFQENR
ncbi:hypothetical protein [Xanthomonas translucens]|uniref:hypothetical protein n=1 Tax=Xanthomonas campestris pv. translucens TaxID=343 RepID=UPI000A693198|nr:hypothetical protein [Xanthomonas translucens]